MREFSKLSDNELARLAATGRRAAFDEIVRRYAGALLAFASSRTLNLQDAEDIVQDTFLRAFSGISSYDPAYPLKSWLFTIAYRVIVSGYRKKRPQLLTEESEEQLVQFDAGENGWIWDEARKMGVDSFAVLWLKYKHGMSVTEIGAVLGRSEAAARVLLHRARKRLGEQLEQDGLAERN